ncbi:MAG: metallophosphoesterase [Planctomycetes bacterium]|nr:metallophosphoesterase [Planctomycetota bacterium]
MLSISLLTATALRAAEPVTVRGRVILDANANGQLDAGEEGFAGVAVEDGVNIVTTDAQGKFEIKVADDATMPFVPARVVAMSWPSNYWPSSLWYRRLADIKPGEELLFSLRPDEQKLPLVFVHGTDPHNSFGDAISQRWRTEVAQLGPAPKFAIVTGDLGYAGPENADAMFSSVQNYSRTFPIPMFITLGNHDIVGIMTSEWNKPTDIQGSNAFTKYLGPLRWSFTYAGVHMIGLDWAELDEKGHLSGGTCRAAIKWLTQEQARLKPGTRVFLFAHSHWSPHEKEIFDLLRKYNTELYLTGHSHKNLDMSFGGLKLLTTVNLTAKEGPYRMVHINANGHDLVDRCPSGIGRHTRSCGVHQPGALDGLRRKKVDVTDITLGTGTRRVEGLEAHWLEVAADIVPPASGRCGMRITSADATVLPMELSFQANEMTSGPLVVPAVKGAGDSAFQVRVHVVNGQAQVRCNSRVCWERPLATDAPLRVEFFSEGDGAKFSKIEAWQLAHDDVAAIQALSSFYAHQTQDHRVREFQKTIDALKK